MSFSGELALSTGTKRRNTFNPPGDEEEAVLVVFSQVTWVQPALCIQSLLRLLWHVEVTHEHVTTPEADFSVSLLVRVVQLRLAPWDLFTTAAEQNTFSSFTFLSLVSDALDQYKDVNVNVPGEFVGVGAGDGVRSGALAHAVQLVQRDVQAEEELQRVFGDGCCACVALAAAIQAQGLTHLFEHKLFG